MSVIANHYYENNDLGLIPVKWPVAVGEGEGSALTHFLLCVSFRELASEYGAGGGWALTPLKPARF